MKPSYPSNNTGAQTTSRRAFFNQTLSTLSLIALPGILYAVDSVPPSSFHFDPHWPALDPQIYPERCQISGVAITKDGRILALNRGENSWNPKGGFNGFKRELIQKPTVLVLEPESGTIQAAWGQNMFVMPHQINVDPDGNVWIVDCGQNKVIKFDATGNPLLEIGGKKIGFDMPTDVAFLKDGRFVVSDGYVNTRIVIFEPNGKQLSEFGTRGTGPRQFKTPHSVAVDSNDLIYIADRENHRIQVLDIHGEVRSIWTNVERPLTLRFRGESLYVLSNLDAEKGIVRQMNLRGEITAVCPTRPPDTDENFDWPHGLSVSADGNTLIVGYTLLARRIQRFQRR